MNTHSLISLCIGRTWRINLLMIVGITLAQCSSNPPERKSSPPDERYNVLLVSFDCLRYDHVGYNGYHHNTTPNIDELACRSTNFQHVYAHSSWTGPTHMSIMTSLYPDVHGLFGVPFPHPKYLGTTTLAMILRDAGYRTWGFVAGSYLKSQFGFSSGFDRYDDDFERQRPSNIVNKRVLTWLKKKLKSPRQPFFLFVHYFDSHYPYNPPEPYNMIFDPQYQGQLTGERESFKMLIRKKYMNNINIDLRDITHAIALYDGETRYADEHFGELLEYLKETGEFDRTLIIVTADHGESFRDHQKIFGHGGTLYNELIHIPLVIKLPDEFSQNPVSDAVVQHLDITPTILETLNIPVPEYMQGKSLLPFIISTEGENPVTFEDTVYSKLINTTRLKRADLLSITTGRWKFISDRLTGSSFLYDLVYDPLERIDLSNDHPDVVLQLTTKLRLLEDENSRRIPGGDQKKHAYNKRLQNELEALGYFR